MSSDPDMTEAEREATRRRLYIWREAQSALEEQHWRELKGLTDEKALLMTKALFSRPLTCRVKRESSGLVEQQILFHRALAQ